MENVQNKNIFDRINDSISQSITFKLISIGIMVMLLLIPKSMISDLIYEREQRMEATVHEITDMWSGSQTVAGPLLTVPYKVYIESEDKETMVESIRYATFLPDELSIESNIVPEERHRGIFKVIVYKAQLRLKGKFQTSGPDVIDHVADL
ncbi:MAG: cell envelope integrity protein CreD [Cyclobacteriaceae bacterium]|nr:cell envelope integrity protein CreD [Cyclobacteriaceae bacterium]